MEDILAAPERHYARRVVYRSDEELEEYAAEVREAADAIAGCTRRRNPDACVRFGRRCEYWAVCTGRARLEDETLYRSAAKAHEEL